MADLSCRLITDADVEPLAQIAAAAFDSESAAAKVKQALQTHLERAGTTPLRGQTDDQVQTEYYVFESEGEIVGMSGLYHPRWIGEAVLYLGWMFLHPDLHGRGFGQDILGQTIQTALDLECVTLMVETSPELQPALALYTKAGFEQVGHVPDYWTPGSDLILMAKRLEPG
jgi:RimJ/RimL family protein N-acetyltransferase